MSSLNSLSSLPLTNSSLASSSASSSSSSGGGVPAKVASVFATSTLSSSSGSSTVPSSEPEPSSSRSYSSSIVSSVKRRVRPQPKYNLADFESDDDGVPLPQVKKGRTSAEVAPSRSSSSSSSSSRASSSSSSSSKRKKSGSPTGTACLSQEEIDLRLARGTERYKAGCLTKRVSRGWCSLPTSLITRIFSFLPLHVSFSLDNGSLKDLGLQDIVGLLIRVPSLLSEPELLEIFPSLRIEEKRFEFFSHLRFNLEKYVRDEKSLDNVKQAIAKVFSRETAAKIPPRAVPLDRTLLKMLMKEELRKKKWEIDKRKIGLKKNFGNRPFPFLLPFLTCSSSTQKISKRIPVVAALSLWCGIKINQEYTFHKDNGGWIRIVKGCEVEGTMSTIVQLSGVCYRWRFAMDDYFKRQHDLQITTLNRTLVDLRVDTLLEDPNLVSSYHNSQQVCQQICSHLASALKTDDLVIEEEKFFLIRKFIELGERYSRSSPCKRPFTFDNICNLVRDRPLSYDDPILSYLYNYVLKDPTISSTQAFSRRDRGSVSPVFFNAIAEDPSSLQFLLKGLLNKSESPSDYYELRGFCLHLLFHEKMKLPREEHVITYLARTYPEICATVQQLVEEHKQELGLFLPPVTPDIMHKPSLTSEEMYNLLLGSCTRIDQEENFLSLWGSFNFTDTDVVQNVVALFRNRLFEKALARYSLELPQERSEQSLRILFDFFEMHVLSTSGFCFIAIYDALGNSCGAGLDWLFTQIEHSSESTRMNFIAIMHQPMKINSEFTATFIQHLELLITNSNDICRHFEMLKRIRNIPGFDAYKDLVIHHLSLLVENEQKIKASSSSATISQEQLIACAGDTRTEAEFYTLWDSINHEERIKLLHAKSEPEKVSHPLFLQLLFKYSSVALPYRSDHVLQTVYHFMIHHQLVKSVLEYEHRSLFFYDFYSQLDSYICRPGLTWLIGQLESFKNPESTIYFVNLLNQPIRGSTSWWQKSTEDISLVSHIYRLVMHSSPQGIEARHSEMYRRLFDIINCHERWKITQSSSSSSSSS